MQNRNVTWTLMPLFLAGVLCNTWKVDYHKQRICAVSGSSVVIPCSFYYPDDYIVDKLIWAHVKSHHQLKPCFVSDRKLNTRFQYIGDRQHNCSLKIHQVERKDAGKYVFIFTTNSKEDKWTGRNGPILKVVDLNVSVTNPNGNRATKEGDSVNLICSNGCGGDDLSSAFTWFKNGEPINEGPGLYLSNVSSTNSGNYTCTLKTHTGTTSGVINIDVEYGPKNTSVFVRPSTDVETNSNVTLICSSHANPPVENYTWFKIHDNDDVLDVGHQSVFFPGDSGQYLCSATNKHGSQNSSVVTLTIKSYWATFTENVLIIAAVAVAVLLIVITVIGVRRLHKKRTRTSNSNSEEDIQDTDYVNWLACDNNQSQERNQPEGGGKEEVVYTSVYFINNNNNRKSNMEQQMDSHSDDDVNAFVTYITVRAASQELSKIMFPNCKPALQTRHQKTQEKRTRAPETDSEEDIQNADYVNRPVCDNSYREEQH